MVRSLTKKTWRTRAAHARNEKVLVNSQAEILGKIIRKIRALFYDQDLTNYKYKYQLFLKYNWRSQLARLTSLHPEHID